MKTDEELIQEIHINSSEILKHFQEDVEEDIYYWLVKNPTEYVPLWIVSWSSSKLREKYDDLCSLPEYDHVRYEVGYINGKKVSEMDELMYWLKDKPEFKAAIFNLDIDELLYEDNEEK